MKTLINKMTSAISGAVLFVAAIAMAGLGFAIVGVLAMFALVGIGIALVAAPFAKLTQNNIAKEPEQEQHAAA